MGKMKITKVLAGIALLGATSIFAADGAALYNTCAACHGMNGEKAALGKSQVIKGWDAAKTEAALKGYKDGSYGGAMKGVTPTKNENKLRRGNLQHKSIGKKKGSKRKTNKYSKKKKNKPKQ